MSLSTQRAKNNQKKHKRNIVKQSKRANRPKKNKSSQHNTKEKKDIRARRRLQKERKNIKKLSEKISNCLGFIDLLAEKTGFTTRQGKILPLAFIVTLAYGLFGGGDKSLILLVSNMNSWFNIKITAQALSKRLKQKKTVNFLKHSFIRVLNFQLSNAFKNKYADLFNCFKAIKLEDATSFELDELLEKDFKGTGGAASRAAMKLNTCYEVMTNTVTNIDICSGTKSDQKFANNVEKTMKQGELLIRDLGYFSLMAMLNMIRLGIYFLSRLQKNIYVYQQGEEKPINLNEWLEKHTQNGNTIDQNMHLGEVKVPVRLIAVKVPESVRQKRIQKFKALRKKEPTEDYVTWCGYSIFITNISKEMFSSDIVISIYKIRWQIELFFKILKQTLCIHVIRTKSKNSTHCMIYAKLISLFTASLVISYAESICEEEELSGDKAMKWLHNDNRFGVAVAQNSLEEILKVMVLELFMLCKDKRKKNKSTYRSLEEAIKYSKVA
jgi:Transposase DDE domain